MWRVCQELNIWSYCYLQDMLMFIYVSKQLVFNMSLFICVQWNLVIYFNFVQRNLFIYFKCVQGVLVIYFIFVLGNLVICFK
jgi:hypothetical protein